MKFSILDPVIIEPNSTSAKALQSSIDLAKYVESLDFARYWIVEHHGVHYEATPSPEILASAILNQTKKINVGVGGFLLNNYSPYKVAEIIKSLNALYPGRVDFGIGQSSSGQLQDFALQANRVSETNYNHDQAMDELIHWLANDFETDNPFSTIPIMRDESSYDNIWALVVSEYSAKRAASLGIKLACSAFHQPEKAVNSIAAYRQNYQHTMKYCATSKPTDLLAIRLIVADTQEEAEKMAMPMRHLFHQRRNLNIMPLTMPTIDEAIADAGGIWPAETSPWPMYVIGDKEQVYAKLSNMIEQTGVNEIMLQDVLPTFDMRKKMYADVAELAHKLR